MTATNPHPFANPLNRQRYAAYEKTCLKPYIHPCSDPSKLSVPQSSMTYEQIVEQQKSLTVPDSASNSTSNNAYAFGFLGNSSLFMLHDGSVIDLKTHKIVLDPNVKFKAAGYWNNPNKDISRHSEVEWGKTPSIESLLADCGSYNGNYDPNLSPESIKYWKLAKEESKKLEQNMTDEQKKLLKDLESEQFFPMSKLKLEQEESN